MAGFVLVWLVVLAVPPLLLNSARATWLASLEDPAAQESWESFRSDMRAHSGREGPVQRKVPRSTEPPLRVWLRDHFGLAITAWIVLGGTLGGFLGMMVVGAATGPAQWPSPRISPPAGGTPTPGSVSKGGRSLPQDETRGGHHGNEEDESDPQNTEQ